MISFKEDCVIKSRKISKGGYYELDMYLRVNGHPNICKLIDFKVVDKFRKIEMRMELGEGVSRGSDRLYCDVLLALEYIHACGYVYGDVKPGNIIEVDGVYKLIDFETMHVLMDKAERRTGDITTYSFEAPEIWDDEDITEKIDIFSVGAIMFDFNMGFAQRSCSRRDIHNSRVELIPKIIDPLMKGMLNLDPLTRWSATRCLDHERFDPFREYIEEVRKYPIDRVKRVINTLGDKLLKGDYNCPYNNDVFVKDLLSRYKDNGGEIEERTVYLIEELVNGIEWPLYIKKKYYKELFDIISSLNYEISRLY